MPGVIPSEERPPHFQPSSQEGTGEQRITLKRDVGLIGGVAVIVGTMIGSGIFASPKYVLEASGSVGMALVVWVLCGVMALLGALSYVELGTMISASGGDYTYIRQAFGPLPAFLYVFTACFVIVPSEMAVICLTFGDYVVTPFFPDCAQRSDVVFVTKLLAALAIGIILVVNCVSVKLATKVQVFFTAAKLLALVIIILTGLVRLCLGYTTAFDASTSFASTSKSVGVVGIAFYHGLWAYDGWNNLNYITEEVHDPNRNMPRAAAFAIPLVTVVYVLTNIAYFTVLSEEEILTGGAVAVIFANRMFGVMSWIIPVFVAFSTFGAANGSALASGRTWYAASKNMELPKFLAMIHNSGFTPIPALVLQSLIAWVMLIPESSSFASLINYFTFATWTFRGTTVLGLLYMRYSRRDACRPFKVPIVIPVVVCLASVYLIVVPFYQNPLPSLYSLLFILCGIPVYFIFIYWKLSPGWLNKASESFTFWLMKFADVSYPQSEKDFVE